MQSNTINRVICIVSIVLAISSFIYSYYAIEGVKLETMIQVEEMKSEFIRSNIKAINAQNEKYDKQLDSISNVVESLRENSKSLKENFDIQKEKIEVSTRNLETLKDEIIKRNNIDYRDSTLHRIARELSD